MFGFDSADEMLNVSVSSLYQKSDDRIVYLEEMHRTGFLQNRELWLKKKDGTPILASCTATAQFNDKGEIEWMDGVIEDITERKRAEEAIRASSQQIADILESISDAFFALDNQWRFTFVNSIAEKLLRKSREELVGKNIWEEFPEAVGSTFHTEYHKALNKNVPVSFEENYSPFDTWYDVRAYPYHGGLSVYFHDINERKQAEAKLKILTEELKRSNQELSQFASVAAHDLQSPLISIGSALQLLRRRLKGILDPETDGFITHTQEMAADMQVLIRNLLDYSRIDRHGTEFTPVDCNDILEKTIENLKVDIQDCGAEITHDPLPEVLGNSTLMVQLFQNLIANAIKFRGDKPPIVQIAVEQREKDYLFSFRDSGIGFDTKYAGRIFEIFQRLHEKGVYPGAGIGLATCKKIVEIHGGRIWVESEPGEGSTFFFTIPSE
jgi:PAS domain S-box-containing protein